MQKNTPRTFFVDIDNTICKTEGTDYAHAIPLEYRINHLNNLFLDGHIVVYYTARGGLSSFDYRPLTEAQLKMWDVKYTQLRMDKPLYDLLIDDRAENARILNLKHHVKTFVFRNFK